MRGTADPSRECSVEVMVSDLSELRSLRTWLERIPAVRVEQQAGSPGPGEQGAVDTLMILAGSGSTLAVAIRCLPEFIRSRRSKVTLTLKAGDKEFTLEADNHRADQLDAIVDKMMPIIDELRDG